MILDYIRTARKKSGLKVREKRREKTCRMGARISKGVFAGLFLERHETLPERNCTLKLRQKT